MTKSPPWHVRYLDAVGASATKGVERAMLLAAGRWVDRSDELFPRLETWSRLAGCDVRSGRRALRALEQKGLIEVVALGGRQAGGNGSSTRYRLLIHGFTRIPDKATGIPSEAVRVDPGQHARNHGHDARVRRTPRPVIPDRVSAEPSMHPSREPSTGTARDTAAPSSTGCMDAPPGPSLRTALVAAGIRGPNLDRLAESPELTADQVGREARSVRADSKVRNVPAVLARRLAVVAGVSLSASPKLDADSLRGIGQLEKIRRSRQQREIA